eukprot:TRINITY_DN13350_c0_g1_i1.p1 TRINITY_DN13350_c0_g1~~TRINITY_DN13350_c0_g1_i1.p1  ORF type:complete len:379 (+),score=70.06 TRINITY_DN13350_c0_g1_i1:122-1138(+)
MSAFQSASNHSPQQPSSPPTGSNSQLSSNSSSSVIAGIVNVSKTRTRKPYTITKQREIWSDYEHSRFLQALHLFGRDWRKIEAHVVTKTVIQIRSHAQKYFLKLQKNSSFQNQTSNNNSPTNNNIKSPGANIPSPETIPPPRPKRRIVESLTPTSPIPSPPQASIPSPPSLVATGDMPYSSPIPFSAYEQKFGNSTSPTSVPSVPLHQLTPFNLPTSSFNSMWNNSEFSLSHEKFSTDQFVPQLSGSLPKLAELIPFPKLHEPLFPWTNSSTKKRSREDRNEVDETIALPPLSQITSQLPPLDSAPFNFPFANLKDKSCGFPEENSDLYKCSFSHILS